MESNLSRRALQGQLSLKWAKENSRPCLRPGIAAESPDPPRSRTIESRLRQLEARYRSALSRTVALKAQYLSLAADPSATTAAIERAQWRWQMLQTRRKAIAAQMAAIEDIERVFP